MLARSSESVSSGREQPEPEGSSIPKKGIAMLQVQSRYYSISRGIVGALIAFCFLDCEDGGHITSAIAQSASTMSCAADSKMEDNDLGGLACQLGLPVHDVALGLRNELRHMLDSYAHALQRGDVAAVEKLLSAELQARIDERGQAADLASKLHDFVRTERRKLSRSVGVLDGRRGAMTVTSAQMLADGSIAALRVAVKGKPLPKPFYFVQEDGSYKLNIIHPDAGFVIQSSYRIANSDHEPRSFSCSDSSSKTIAPTPAEMYESCSDSCPTIWDGTRFSTSQGSADCDYNTWGIDMTIVNGYPVCNDPC
jgi:hypothetical protein